MFNFKSIRSAFCAVAFLFVFVSAGFGFQTPGFYYDEDRTLCDLANKADFIVTGTVSERLSIVDTIERAKEYARWNDYVAKSLDAGDPVDFVNIPKMEKFVTGTLFTFDLGEVIFSRENVKTNEAISFLVNGYPLVFHSGIPHFATGSSYLLHLSRAETGDFKPNSMLLKVGAKEMKEVAFEKDGLFVITPGASRFPPLTEENTALVDKARRFTALRNTCAVE